MAKIINGTSHNFFKPTTCYPKIIWEEHPSRWGKTDTYRPDTYKNRRNEAIEKEWIERRYTVGNIFYLSRDGHASNNVVKGKVAPRGNVSGYHTYLDIFNTYEEAYANLGKYLPISQGVDIRLDLRTEYYTTEVGEGDYTRHKWDDTIQDYKNYKEKLFFLSVTAAEYVKANYEEGYGEILAIEFAITENWKRTYSKEIGLYYVKKIGKDTDYDQHYLVACEAYPTAMFIYREFKGKGSWVSRHTLENNHGGMNPGAVEGFKSVKDKMDIRNVDYPFNFIAPKREFTVQTTPVEDRWAREPRYCEDMNI